MPNNNPFYSNRQQSLRLKQQFCTRNILRSTNRRLYGWKPDTESLPESADQSFPIHPWSTRKQLRRNYTTGSSNGRIRLSVSTERLLCYLCQNLDERRNDCYSEICSRAATDGTAEISIGGTIRSHRSEI